MSIFDPYFKEVHRYLETMREKYGSLREVDCPRGAEEVLEGLPVRIGPQASSGIILKEDTFVELGSPDTASCAFLLWTETPALIRDGRVTLIGPDIAESQGENLPFGQVMMVGGRDLQEEHQEALDRTQYAFDKIEGYMVRSVPQRMWSRVSKDAVDRGFSFETLGRALMGICKAALPEVEAVEVVLVSSSKEDLAPLESVAAQVANISRDIRRRTLVRAPDGTYRCTSEHTCKACSDKPVCDDIRHLVVLRKGRRRRLPQPPSQVSGARQ